jgi:ATP-dependent Clp protease ATP-binding subunit ClpA
MPASPREARRRATISAVNDLVGFDKAARTAVEAAEAEARRLGHQHVGTEHLMLALLAGDASPAGKMLRDAGVTLAAARRKVSEAVGVTVAPETKSREPLPRTSRVNTAISRAARFAHARNASRVGAKHVLLGVLDVEGRGGQVLRGLGVDVERLRKVIDNPRLRAKDPAATKEAATPKQSAAPRKAAASGRAPVCPSCSVSLENVLVYRKMPATGPQGERDVVVVSCGNCRVALSIFPPNRPSAT